jgi:two-component sensor histidine kinase
MPALFGEPRLRFPIGTDITERSGAMMATGSSPILRSRLELACEPSATRYALGHARDVVGRWRLPRAVAEDALLVVDELVINAVRHAGAAAEAFEPGRGQPRVRACALVLWVVGEDLLIAVQDQSDQPPVLREVSLDAEDGRGLQLVAGLSDGRWGLHLPARSHRKGDLGAAPADPAATVLTHRRRRWPSKHRAT